MAMGALTSPSADSSASASKCDRSESGHSSNCSFVRVSLLQPGRSQRAVLFKTKSALANGRSGDISRNAATSMPHMPTDAASAIAATAQVRFVRILPVRVRSSEGSIFYQSQQKPLPPILQSIGFAPIGFLLRPARKKKLPRRRCPSRTKQHRPKQVSVHKLQNCPSNAHKRHCDPPP